MSVEFFFLVAIIIINVMLMKWVYVLRQYFHLKEIVLGVITVIMWLIFDISWLMRYYGCTTDTIYNSSFMLVLIIIVGSLTIDGLIKTMTKPELENAEEVNILKEGRRSMIYMGGALLIKIICEILE